MSPRSAPTGAATDAGDASTDADADGGSDAGEPDEVVPAAQHLRVDLDRAMAQPMNPGARSLKDFRSPSTTASISSTAPPLTAPGTASCRPSAASTSGTPLISTISRAWSRPRSSTLLRRTSGCSPISGDSSTPRLRHRTFRRHGARRSPSSTTIPTRPTTAAPVRSISDHL